MDDAALRALAVRYVARYATTQAKLRDYLKRKLAERDWTGDEPPAIDAIIGRCRDLGFIDDRAYAVMRSGALLRRGYGQRRVAGALTAAGIDRETIAEVEPDEAAAYAAAMRLARKRRFGGHDPAVDRAARQRQFAAMLRAGHRPDIVRRVLDADGRDDDFQVQD